VGVLTSSFSVVNTGDAAVPVTITVYVPVRGERRRKAGQARRGASGPNRELRV